MQRALRVLAVAAVWGAVSFFGPAAHAHHSIVFAECSSPQPTPTSSPSATPTPTPEPQNCVPAAGSRITATRTIQFEVRADSARPIEQVDLYILSEEQGIPSANNRQPVLSRQYPNRNQAPAQETYTFPWDSVTLTPYNGRYQVAVVASTHGQHPDGEGSTVVAQTRQDLRVDNPPKAIAAPRIVAKTASTATVEWDKAVEPDVLSYRLYRATSSNTKKAPPINEFKLVATTAATNVRDKVDEGVHWYAVQVTRRSIVTPETGISSPLSPVSKPTQIEKAAAAPKGGGAGAGGGAAAPAPQPRVFSRLPRLTVANPSSGRPAPVPDAPYSAYLPYDVPEGAEEIADQPEGGADPRGPVLPVAVGAFLVSSALALGRMPY